MAKLMKQTEIEKEQRYLETLPIIKGWLREDGYLINDYNTEKNLGNGWIINVILSKNYKQSSMVFAKNIENLYNIDLFKDTDIKCLPNRQLIRNSDAIKTPLHIASGWAKLLEMRILDIIK
jgi:hypothetical protein